HPAVADQVGHYPGHVVLGDGEADPGAPSRRAVDRRVDSDQPPRAVEQRAPRVAGIDRGVGLDDAADRRPRFRLDLAAERADHPRRQALVEAERVADGEDALAHLQPFRVAERQRRQLPGRRIDLEDGQMPLGGDADELRVPGGAVGERHLGGVRAGNNVVVGDDVPLAVPDEAGPLSLGNRRFVETEDVLLHRQRGDEHRRRRGALEERDGRLLLVLERRLGLRRDRPAAAVLGPRGSPLGRGGGGRGHLARRGAADAGPVAAGGGQQGEEHDRNVGRTWHGRWPPGWMASRLDGNPSKRRTRPDYPPPVPGPFKDDVLDHLARRANIAQFVSFGPDLVQRHAWIRGLPACPPCGWLEEAIAAILAAAQESWVTVRSFDPESPKSRAFLYGETDSGRIA